MLLIDNKTTDPEFNLALEEHLIKTSKEDVFMLWVNAPAIIVGKNQNTLSEINQDFVEANGIKVVRRLSGGGAVYHDHGNLNFTFILNNTGEDFNDFEKFTRPVLSLLSKLGADAGLRGRNDLMIGDGKISGNAQYWDKNRLMHHGTLLFSTDLSVLGKALIPDKEKVQSKGVKSALSRVTNISEHLSGKNKKMTLDSFKKALISEVRKSYTDIVPYELTGKDIAAADRLKDEKYGMWDWNYGYSPKYTFRNKKRFEGGSVEAYLEVSDGIIRSAKFFGDFFSKRDVSEAEALLLGVPHRYENIKEALMASPAPAYGAIKDYFSNIKIEEVLQILL